MFGSWAELVGREVAAHARPVSLDRGCLLVVVDESGWATRFRYEQAGLLERFAAELGEGVVTRIDVRCAVKGRKRLEGGPSLSHPAGRITPS